VDVYETTVMGTRLLGVLVTGNNNALLVPDTITQDELSRLRSSLGDFNVVVVRSRSNALGNIIVANSHGALVYPNLEDEVVKVIRDALGVEVVKRSIGGISSVGTVVAVTDVGGLVHPDATDEEVEFLRDLFKVPFRTGTVNFGVSFVRTGLVVNSKGAIVGNDTSGPEIARIQTTFTGL